MVTLLEDRLRDNLARVRGRIDAAAARANRDPQSVRLVAVTKTEGIDVIRALVELGVTDLGENRVETAADKIRALASPAVRWHMIGSIQRRKARDAAGFFDCIDSVDRFDLAETLQKRLEELELRRPVLIEVNVSGENTKHGFTPDTVAQALEDMRRFDRLDIRGLMTMAPFVDDPESVRPVFRGLRLLAARLGLPELSMGMSNDFEVAVEEGATQVRVGTALFA